MRYKKKPHTLALSVLLVIGLIGFGMVLGYEMTGKNKAERTILFVSDTVIVSRTDTCILREFDTIVENVVKYRNIYVHDTAFVFADDTIRIPITQKWYHQDSLCDVWISGYEPNLDSLHVVQRHTVEIIREKETVNGSKNIVGIEAGIKEANIMYLHEVGKFNVGVSAGSTYQGEPTGRIVVGFHF